MGRAAGRLPFQPSRAWIGPVLLLGAAISFWVPFLSQAENSVFGRVPILDEVYYLDQAAAWSSGTAPPAEAFFVSPLYPLLIAWAGGGDAVPVDRVIPPGRLRGVRLFQVFCWFGVAVLLRLTAGRILGPKIRGPGGGLLPWVPPILFALYRPAAVYSVSILLELPLVLLVTAAIYLMIRAHDEDEPRNFLWLVAGTGAVIGLAGLLRGTALVMLVPAVMVAVRFSGQRATRNKGVVVLVSVALLLLLPAVIHNSRLAGRPAPPTLNAGVNLFIGNGPEANGFYVAVVPGDWRSDPAGRDFLGNRMGTAPLSLVEADRIWRREARDAMTKNPARAAALWGKKIWLHFQGWEIDQLTPLDRWRRAAPALHWLPVPFALLVILGLTGAVARWPDRRVRIPVIALAVIVMGQSLFFVVSRYRLVLVPLLCLLAVLGVVEILNRNRRAIGAALLAVLLVVPWGLGSTRELWAAQARANEARRWAEVGLADDSVEALQTAEKLYREAIDGLADRDGGPAPWLGLASVLAEQGQIPEAMEVLREGSQSTAGHLPINKVLLALYLESGDRDEALDLTRTILADSPRDADTLHNRTILLFEKGAASEAAETARTLVEFHPADPRGYVDLGIILAREGNPDQARAVFERGLEAVPNHPDLEKNLAILDR